MKKTKQAAIPSIETYRARHARGLLSDDECTMCIRGEYHATILPIVHCFVNALSPSEKLRIAQHFSDGDDFASFCDTILTQYVIDMIVTAIIITMDVFSDNEKTAIVTALHYIGALADQFLV